MLRTDGGVDNASGGGYTQAFNVESFAPNDGITRTVKRVTDGSFMFFIACALWWWVSTVVQSAPGIVASRSFSPSIDYAGRRCGEGHLLPSPYLYFPLKTNVSLIASLDDLHLAHPLCIPSCPRLSDALGHVSIADHAPATRAAYAQELIDAPVYPTEPFGNFACIPEHPILGEALISALGLKRKRALIWLVIEQLGLRSTFLYQAAALVAIPIVAASVYMSTKFPLLLVQAAVYPLPLIGILIYFLLPGNRKLVDDDGPNFAMQILRNFENSCQIHLQIVLAAILTGAILTWSLVATTRRLQLGSVAMRTLNDTFKNAAPLVIVPIVLTVVASFFMIWFLTNLPSLFISIGLPPSLNGGVLEVAPVHRDVSMTVSRKLMAVPRALIDPADFGYRGYGPPYDGEEEAPPAHGLPRFSNSHERSYDWRDSQGNRRSDYQNERLRRHVPPSDPIHSERYFRDMYDTNKINPYDNHGQSEKPLMLPVLHSLKGSSSSPTPPSVVSQENSPSDGALSPLRDVTENSNVPQNTEEVQHFAQAQEVDVVERTVDRLTPVHASTASADLDNVINRKAIGDSNEELRRSPVIVLPDEADRDAQVGVKTTKSQVSSEYLANYIRFPFTARSLLIFIAFFTSTLYLVETTLALNQLLIAAWVTVWYFTKPIECSGRRDIKLKDLRDSAQTVLTYHLGSVGLVACVNCVLRFWRLLSRDLTFIPAVNRLHLKLTAKFSCLKATSRALRVINESVSGQTVTDALVGGVDMIASASQPRSNKSYATIRVFSMGATLMEGASSVWAFLLGISMTVTVINKVPLFNDPHTSNFITSPLITAVAAGVVAGYASMTLTTGLLQAVETLGACYLLERDDRQIGALHCPEQISALSSEITRVTNSIALEWDDEMSQDNEYEAIEGGEDVLRCSPDGGIAFNDYRSEEYLTRSPWEAPPLKSVPGPSKATLNEIAQVADSEKN